MKLTKLSLLTMLFVSSYLGALEFGKGKQKHDFEGVKWQEVMHKGNGLSFTGFLPNYEGAILSNNNIMINGSVDNQYYQFRTFVNSGKIPSSGKKFKEFVEKNNPNVTVGWLDAKKLNVKYAVEFTSIDENVQGYWRIVCTKKHIILMGTSDINQARRTHFFDSFRVK